MTAATARRIYLATRDATVHLEAEGDIAFIWFPDPNGGPRLCIPLEVYLEALWLVGDPQVWADALRERMGHTKPSDHRSP
jgi:hypothetical protein